MKQFFSTNEAAEYLDLVPATLRYHIYQAKDLTGQILGNSLLFTREQLDEFKANKRPPGRPKMQD